MHELSLCQGMLRIIEESAAREGFARVVQVRLEIGPLAAVDSEALRFAFEVAGRGTVVEGAEVVIDSPPAEGHCPACGAATAVRDYLQTCPRCGGALDISGGMAMRIKELEVE